MQRNFKMEKLLKILNEIRPDVDFIAQNALIDRGILDSFDVISIVGYISDEFNIDIPVEEIDPENFNSAQKMLLMIERLQQEE
jgi:Phosphopantetheine attachment site.